MPLSRGEVTTAPRPLHRGQAAASFKSLGKYHPDTQFQANISGFSPLRDNRRPGRVASTMSENAAAWPLPVDAVYRISSTYGYRTHPVTGDYRFHHGVDLAAPSGTTVLATHDGVVSETGTHRHLGKYVKIRHNDKEYSVYGHLSKWLVTQGRRVARGEVIGKVGSTGRSTGAHLDYSLRVNGQSVNPMLHLIPPG